MKMLHGGGHWMPVKSYKTGFFGFFWTLQQRQLQLSPFQSRAATAKNKPSKHNLRPMVIVEQKHPCSLDIRQTRKCTVRMSLITRITPGTRAARTTRAVAGVENPFHEKSHITPRFIVRKALCSEYSCTWIARMS